MHSRYRYHGCLKHLQDPPAPEALKKIKQINFPGESLENWKCRDDPGEKEWQEVTVRVKRSDGGYVIRGLFDEIRRIDNLERNDPRFWAPLSVASEEDPRFPLDCIQFPLVEVTYRCVTHHAGLACQWSYPGGAHLVHLEPSLDWQTAALLIPQRGFPKSITRFTLRVYALRRSEESVEIGHVRFRALLPHEIEALESRCHAIQAVSPPRRYPLLDEFLPFGVSMNAETADHLADMMDIAYFDYWRLAFEDIARHHHNCVVLDGVHKMTADDRGVLVDLAENFGLRLIPTFDWPLERFDAEGDEWIETFIAPYADSNGILAWNILDNPTEQNFQEYLKARDKIAAVDARHPVIIHTRQADAFPLYAPSFAAAGFSHFKSGDPIGVGDALRAHLPLVGGQQLWVTAPAFVYASDAPAWSSSPQLRLMLNMTLANGARGWLAHTYHNSPVWADGHYQRSLTGPFLTFSDLWAELGNRVERLSVLAPLFLSACPADPPESYQFEANAQKNPKSPLKKDSDALSIFWLKGPDYYLCYLVNNDTSHVTSVNLKLPDSLPDGMEVYDTTALVRIRAWTPAPRQRHLEMFPGQGQLFLVAEPPVCARWREVIARRILQADRRQTRVDLELARQYRLDVADIESTLREVDEEMSLESLNRAHGAREELFNLIYATPAIFETRQLLVKASSIICGCDEALSALHGRGHTEQAHELGVKVVPFARTLTDLRIRLRKGHGSEVREEALQMTQKSTDLLREIWNTHPRQAT